MITIFMKRAVYLNGQNFKEGFMEMNRSEVEEYLRIRGWSPFYSNNYWIAKGGSDYSGIPLCQAYVQEKFGRHIPDLFERVVDLEYQINSNKRLYIVGKTYGAKDQLKNLWHAKWDANRSQWYVSADKIKDKTFHDFCYNKKHNFKFQWEK